MDDSVIKEVIETVAKEQERDYFADFGHHGYAAARIIDENFKEIQLYNNRQTIVFIDGGNAEIAGSANFSFQFFRFYQGMFKGTERLDQKKKEYFGLMATKEVKDTIVFSAKLFNGNDSVDFDPYDSTLKEGVKRAKISKIADVIRRYEELELAIDVADHLNENDIIVLDGNLEAAYTGEKTLFERLYRKAGERNIIIAGFSKTTSLLTKKGSALTSVLLRKKPTGKWYYSSIVEVMNDDHKADIFFVKLHEDSPYVFRVDLYDGVPYDAEKVFSALAVHARDPLFLGYPYGLIEADRFARVSNQEKEMLKTHFRVKCGADFEKIMQISAAQNAHEILDGKI